MKSKQQSIALAVINSCKLLPSSRFFFESSIIPLLTRIFREFRQDMGGVGSFNTQNKTLYVGRIAPTDDMEEVVRKHFEPFGAIEKSKLKAIITALYEPWPLTSYRSFYSTIAQASRRCLCNLQIKK